MRNLTSTETSFVGGGDGAYPPNQPEGTLTPEQKAQMAEAESIGKQINAFLKWLGVL